MPWQDRLRTAAYTSPSGTRIPFDYQDVSRTTPKRTTAFSFRGINDNYIQDNGYGSRQYGLRCFFWGDDHDRDATAFEAMLLEKGVGQLEHPFYGTFDVVPFGSIERRDDLVTAANQSVVECVFWTTTGVVYPTSQRSPKNEVHAAIEDYKVAQSESYGDTMEVATVADQKSLRGTVESGIAKADEFLSVPSGTLSEATKEFRSWQNLITRGINALVGNPALLAQQVVNMLLSPARAAVGIQNHITSYTRFLESVFTSAAATPSAQPCACENPKRQVRMANDFRTMDLHAQAALVAMALAAIETEYRTKPEALSVAEAILAQFAAVAAWREQGYATLSLPQYGARLDATDDGIAWQQTTRTVTLCAGFLVDISFTLTEERVVTLDRPRTIIDLAGELYGSIDDRLDFLIATNDLTGSEILELPRGARIVWYP